MVCVIWLHFAHIYYMFRFCQSIFNILKCSQKNYTYVYPIIKRQLLFCFYDSAPKAGLPRRWFNSNKTCLEIRNK